jgi:hypothetical protein
VTVYEEDDSRSVFSDVIVAIVTVIIMEENVCDLLRDNGSDRLLSGPPAAWHDVFKFYSNDE